MDAFVSRKKRKLSPPPTASTLEDINASSAADDESTDFKLAILSSLHPYIEQNVLLDVLLAHEGSVEKASASLKPSDSPPRKSATIGYQSSLSTFVSQNNTEDSGGKRAKLLSKKGKTLHLYDPADVAAHTPCSIIHNFLPTENANALLEELLTEVPTYERMTFKLFDNVVQSPHTASFYVHSYEEMQKQKTDYIYNGGLLTDVRQLTPQMRRVSPQVEAAVNSEIHKRIKACYPDGKKLKHQSPHPWKPNAAFVNCYDGGGESVGYHSDQLTYLGPRAIIGSISLGVAREFRVRRIIPQDEEKKEKSKEDGDMEGQIAIHLPHNSLLVMHAEMQEEWKHSIAPAQAIDPHPISGKKRINITYRDYKATLHPKYTPRCKCDVPAVLRVVQRKKENWGKYFWMCHAGNVPEKDGCTFFKWAKFDDDGDPIWDDSGHVTKSTRDEG
ncbi:related to CUE domain protein [Phialocephala subalpina]|uniref:Related to CUE domain protein n=1 Tax=Phialocephala subalpina TaxID=576137 RepID=A0A1L7XPT4_9HELO|nr:related to CUE domain protein [Phialocephala subalpina]